MSDLVQDLINKRGDTTPPRQAIMKTYILQFMYRDGNGWAFVNATTPNQAEKVFKNQTKYVDARVIAIKETKWYGDSMQLVFEGAVTTFKNIDVTIDLATILRSTGQYKTLEDFLVNYLGLDNYYTKEEVDNKIDNIAKVDLTNYYTKKEINDKLKEMSLDGIEIDINDEGYWTINGVSTGKSAVGVPGAPGPVWSIGEDGYWYKDGIKQGYKAVGEFDFNSLSEEQREQLAGKGIANIFANYALSTSNTTAPPDNSSAWSVSVKTPTASQKYLWAKFIFVLTDNSRKIVGPFVLGNYAKDGTGNGEGGSNITVVSSEEDAVNDNTLYFFDNSLLQGVGLYNTLLQQGWIDIAEKQSSPSDFSWQGKEYLALGDSITDPTTHPENQNSKYPGVNKYCKIAADTLGLHITNVGVSGSTMTDSSLYNYPVTTSSIPTQWRSFIHELAPLGEEDIITDDTIRDTIRGPYSITDWSKYDLISIMLGTNDMSLQGRQITAGTTNDVVYSPSTTEYAARNRTAYYNAYEEAILHILSKKKPEAVLLLCIPPTNYHEHRNTSNVADSTIHDVFARGLYNRIIHLYNKYKNAGYNIELVNFYGEVSGSTVVSTVVEESYDDFIDAVHLTKSGHQKLAAVLVNKLNQIASNLGGSTTTNAESVRHYYHPGNLYKRYDDGSFDILENNEEHGTEVIDNTVYYHYIDKDGLTKKSRTTMKYYGDIMVPHNIHLAETSDTAHLVMRVTGPFFAQSTPVTIHYDSSKVTVYEVTGITSENVTAFSTQIKAYNSEKIVVADGSIFDFTYDNFINPRVLLVVRKYNTINDLKTSLNTTVTFSTPYENNVVNVSVMYGSCDIFYKKGTNYSVFENTSSSNITTLSGKDYFAAKDKCTVTAAVSRSINQTKRNMFYVKIRNIPSKEPTLKATRDRRYYSDISSTLEDNIISFTLSDSYIVGRIKYLGLRLTGSYYKVKNVKIRKASGTETTVVTYTTNNSVTSSSPIDMKRDYFSTLEVGDTIKIQIEKTNESAFEYAVKFTDGECYFLTDNLGIAASSDSYIGAYYSSLVPRGGLNSILNDVTIFGSKVVAIPMTDIRVETIQANYTYNRPNADVLSEEDIITIDALKVLTDYDSPCCIEEIGVVTYDEYEKSST